MPLFLLSWFQESPEETEIFWATWFPKEGNFVSPVSPVCPGWWQQVWLMNSWQLRIAEQEKKLVWVRMCHGPMWKLYKSTYWYHINYSHLNLLHKLTWKTKLLFCYLNEYLKVWFDCQNVIWFINDNNLQETSVTVSGVRVLLSCTLFVLLKPRPLVWGVVPVQC